MIFSQSVLLLHISCVSSIHPSAYFESHFITRKKRKHSSTQSSDSSSSGSGSGSSSGSGSGSSSGSSGSGSDSDSGGTADDKKTKKVVGPKLPDKERYTMYINYRH